LVDDAVSAVGGEVVRTKVGDVHVAERTAEPDVVFGGEPSGAWIWPDETLCPDGPFAAAQLAALIDRSGPLSSLIGDIETYPIRRRAIEVRDRDNLSAMDPIQEAIATRYGAPDTTDGVRIELDDAWFLVRPSGTEPLIRVNVEARDPERVDDVLAEVTEIVETAIGLRSTADTGRT
jgi:phosphoglucosamine mutase